jgi:hypothetical protein
VIGFYLEHGAKLRGGFGGAAALQEGNAEVVTR